MKKEETQCGLCRYFQSLKRTNQIGNCLWTQRFAPFIPRSVISTEVNFSDSRPCHAWKPKESKIE